MSHQQNQQQMYKQISKVRNTFHSTGLTVPLPNPFSGTGRKSPLTNIDRFIQEGQVYQITAGNNSQFQPANTLKLSLTTSNSFLLNSMLQRKRIQSLEH